LLTNTDGIATDGKHLYYTLMGNPNENNGAIHRVDMDGKNHQIVVPTGGTWTPKQLQVVPAHEKLYWCDREGMRVMRYDINWQNAKVSETCANTLALYYVAATMMALRWKHSSKLA
jgi:sugar lactone lactonase YvrE